MNAADHLGAEIQFGYRNQILSPDELRRADAHLSTCAACREALAKDMGVAGMLDSAPTRRWPIAPFAIAASFLVVASAAIWFSIHRAAVVDVAKLYDHETVQEQQTEGDVLEAGHLAVPDFAKDLTTPKQVPRGETTRGLNLELLSPAATALLDVRPTFRWKPMDGDWTYQVRVYRKGSEQAEVSGETTAAEWTPASDLASGIIYQWQVIAQQSSERVPFPRAPPGAPRFLVVDSATSQRLRELARKRGGVHLLLAIEYGKAGLLEDARRELQAELPRSNYPEAVGRLIQSLDSQYR